MRVKIRFMKLQKYTLDLPAQNMALVKEKNTFGQLSNYSDKHELLKTLKKSIDPENIMGPKVFLINRIRKTKYK